MRAAFLNSFILSFCVVAVVIFPNTAEAQPSPRVKRILSIDGGGIRGILPAQILVRLEQTIRNETGNRDAKIGDYFDFIAGTSTGGIMALAILTDKSAAEIANLWATEGGRIFKKGSCSDNTWCNKYEPDNLVAVLKEALGENTRMTSFQKPHAITAYDISRYQPHLFSPESYEQNDFLAWQVGRATSAAPSYFPSMQTSSIQTTTYNFVDGGIMANNPTQLALANAMKFFHDSDASKFAVLSLGTGEDPTTIADSKSWGGLQWLNNGNLLGMMMTAPAMGNVDSVGDIFSAADRQDHYLRIQYNTAERVIAECRSVNFDMDDASANNIRNLQQCGSALAAGYATQLQRFARILVGSHNTNQLLPAGESPRMSSSPPQQPLEESGFQFKFN